MAEKVGQKGASIAEEKMCFVIMPISDSENYVKGHFKHVYQDIIRPACQQAGFSPVRGDEVKQSNLIHLDILQKLLEAPMAVCDLSARNPNVLFELALRQAFDKPVALIQEVGTPPIFDISPFRYTEYRKERIYHEVLDDQKAISEAVNETFESHGKGRSINSIVKLLALSRPAALPEIGPPEAKADLQQIILSELSQLRNEVRMVRKDANSAVHRVAHREILPEVERIREMLMHMDVLLCSDDITSSERIEIMLAESRHRLMKLMHSPEDCSLRDREMVHDLDRRLDMFANEYQKRKDLISKKQK